MDPFAFERLSQRLLRECGFSQVAVTKKTGDGGIDGTGKLRINGIFSFNVAFQCKRYKGFFDDYEVKENNVYIKCEITIKNTTDKIKSFKMYTKMKEDVEGGLLKDAILYAYNEDQEEENFSIEGKEKKTFDVCFVGEFGGKNHKQNRLLPEIIIQENT